MINVFIKLMKESHLPGDRTDHVVAFLNEVTILKGLEHQKIIKLLDYG